MSSSCIFLYNLGKFLDFLLKTRKFIKIMDFYVRVQNVMRFWHKKNDLY